MTEWNGTHGHRGNTNKTRRTIILKTTQKMLISHLFTEQFEKKLEFGATNLWYTIHFPNHFLWWRKDFSIYFARR